MKTSKILLYLTTIIAFFVILLNFPSTQVHFGIPADNPVMGYFFDNGWLDSSKVDQGNYMVDKKLEAPSVLGVTPELKFGIDLQGGTLVELKADFSNIASSDQRSQLEVLKQIIEGRINQFGISETTVRTTSDNRIIVEIPGSGADVEDKLSILKANAILKILEERETPLQGTIDPNNITTIEQYLQYQKEYYTNNFQDTGIVGADIKTAYVDYDNTSGGYGKYAVLIQFTDSGSAKMTEIWNRNIGKRIPILLDGAPILDRTITSDGTQSSTITVITAGGYQTLEEAKKVADTIKGGALPVPLTVAAQRLVEPTLGQDSWNQSLLAGGIGILAVIIFMLLNYKGDGVIAALALILYTGMSLTLFKVLGVTLTLVGVAGFIISIGIAVDANILIFERMRDEKKKGASRATAYRLGFKHAWAAIQDSNTSTLITCLILFVLGNTWTRSFAISLALGVIVSLFTAISFTRLLISIFRK
jgi:protein-export membrane protein SecD